MEMEERAFQTSDQAAASTSPTPNCTQEDFFTPPSCSPGTTSNGSDTVGNVNANDFASAALWAVVLSILGAIVALALFLCFVRRRMRRRARQRVRNVLWDMVHGVQEGRIDEAVLRRLVDAEFGEKKVPVLYEASLSFNQPTNRYSTEGNKFSNAKALMDTDAKPTTPALNGSNSIRWKWTDLLPVSTTQPYPMSNDPTKAYPKIKSQRAPLFQLPFSTPPKHKENVDAATSPHAKVASASATDEGEMEKGLEGKELEIRHITPENKGETIERRIDPVLLIAMPHATRLNLSSQSSLLHPQMLVDAPIELGVSYTIIQESLKDPLVPLPVRKRNRQKEADVMAHALSSRRAGTSAGGGDANASEAGGVDDFQREAERLRRERREERDRVRSQWVDDGHDWLGINNGRNGR